jgi:hypothetical protein
MNELTKMLLDMSDERLGSGLNTGELKDKESLINRVFDLHVVCRNLIGALRGSLAEIEAYPTPWEYLSDPILTDAARNDGRMNQLARDGWELRFISSGWMFWRRRKAVAEIAAKGKPE